MHFKHFYTRQLRYRRIIIIPVFLFSNAPLQILFKAMRNVSTIMLTMLLNSMLFFLAKQPEERDVWCSGLSYLVIDCLTAHNPLQVKR